MTRATTYGWIFLALDLGSRTSPVSLQQIIAAADALNHDIPARNEIQEAIGWLTQQRFIFQQGRNYGLTDCGRDLLAEMYSKAPRPFDTWKLLEQRFVTAETPTELADISQHEFQQAYDKYRHEACKR